MDPLQRGRSRLGFGPCSPFWFGFSRRLSRERPRRDTTHRLHPSLARPLGSFMLVELVVPAEGDLRCRMCARVLIQSPRRARVCSHAHSRARGLGRLVELICRTGVSQAAFPFRLDDLFSISGCRHVGRAAPQSVPSVPLVLLDVVAIDLERWAPMPYMGEHGRLVTSNRASLRGQGMLSCPTGSLERIGHVLAYVRTLGTRKCLPAHHADADADEHAEVRERPRCPWPVVRWHARPLCGERRLFARNGTLLAACHTLLWCQCASRQVRFMFPFDVLPKRSRRDPPIGELSLIRSASSTHTSFRETVRHTPFPCVTARRAVTVSATDLFVVLRTSASHSQLGQRKKWRRTQLKYALAEIASSRRISRRF